jgi:hypothetical protein
MLLQCLSVAKSPHAIGFQFSASLTACCLQPTCDTTHARTPCSAQGDLTNMDSGDALGDMFFASRDRWLPLACTSSEPPGECHMTEVRMRCNDRAAAASDLIRTRTCTSFSTRFMIFFFLFLPFNFPSFHIAIWAFSSLHICFRLTKLNCSRLSSNVGLHRSAILPCSQSVRWSSRWTCLKWECSSLAT